MDNKIPDTGGDKTPLVIYDFWDCPVQDLPEIGGKSFPVTLSTSDYGKIYFNDKPFESEPE